MCQWPDVAVTLFGTHVAESILASVHVRAHQQAGHMNASDPIKSSKNSCREVVVHIWHIDSVEGELGVLGSLETGEAAKEDGSGAEGKLGRAVYRSRRRDHWCVQLNAEWQRQCERC